MVARIACSPLEQEGRVDERSVVKPDQSVDLFLGAADGRLAHGAKAVPVLDLQVQDGTTTAAPGSLADYSIDGFAQREIELNLHVLLVLINEIVVAPGASLAP
jgi:hypothetical protein